MNLDSDDDGSRSRVVHADDLLPSLAQQVRVTQLNGVRWILWVLGILIAGGGVALIGFADEVGRLAVDHELKKEIGGRQNVAPEKKAELKEVERHASRTLTIMGGLGTVLGFTYLIFGAFVKKFPGPITIMALVMFLASNAVLMAVADDPVEALVGGWIWKVGILIFLGKSVHQGIAYEREQRQRERRRSHREKELREDDYDRSPREEEADRVYTCGQCGKFVPRDEQICLYCHAPLRRNRASRRDAQATSFQEDAWSIKAVLWLFVALLAMSIGYGWYVHFGDGMPVGGKKQMEMGLLKQMLVFDILSTILVISAIAIAGRPPPIHRQLTTRFTAWTFGAPVLALVLGLNILYGKVLQDYVGKHPHLEIIQVNFDTSFWLVLLTMCIQPAVIEEIFFRYLALGNLRRIMRDHGAVWVSAVMFGFAHLHNPIGMPILILCGAALGYMRIMSGGMFLPMLMHGFHNALVMTLEGKV